MSDEERDTEYRALAEELIARLDAGDQQGMQDVVDRLTRLRETELFREIGQLTRDLHEALKSFRLDSRLSDIAESEIPDARDRLNHVIEVTSRSAHRTLQAVEAGLPLADEIGTRAGALNEEWQRFRRRELSADEFRELSHRIDSFLELAANHSTALHQQLSDALMAQDYQDITGQIIKRVIALVQEVEGGLVELVRISGQRIGGERQTGETQAAADTPNERSEQKLAGPAVPGHDEETVSGQDEVDDLLSSLGF